MHDHLQHDDNTATVKPPLLLLGDTLPGKVAGAS